MAFISFFVAFMAFMAFIALAFWSFIASDPPAFPERRGFRFRLAFGLGGAAAFADMAFIAMALFPRRKRGAEQLVSIGDPYEASSMVVYRNLVKKQRRRRSINCILVHLLEAKWQRRSDSKPSPGTIHGKQSGGRPYWYASLPGKYPVVIFVAWEILLSFLGPPNTQALIAAAASFLAASRSLIGQPWPTHDKPIPIVAGILPGVTAASEA